MSAALSGARLGLSRLGTRSVLTLTGCALVSVIAVSLLERRTGSVVATDRALFGVAMGIVLPLFAYGASVVSAGGRSSTDAVWVHARHGVDRRVLGLGLLGSTMVVCGLVGLAVAVLAVLLTRFPADPQLTGDLLTSAWIGALGGASYAAYFGLGSTFGRRGGGRLAFLALDWILGASTGVLAAPWPRGHLRNLLGGSPPLLLPQYAATVLLLVLTILAASWACRRTPA